MSEREVYDEAVGIVQWLRAEGLKAMLQNEVERAQRIATAAEQLAALLPLATKDNDRG